MAVVADHRHTTTHPQVVDRLATRHRRVAVATAIAGAAFVMLVGRDGTLGWQIARVAGVVLLSTAVLALETRVGDRTGGRIAVTVGVVVLAIGVGFVPYVVEEGL